MKDPYVRFMNHWAVVVGWILLGFLFPYLVGGWEGMLWGGVIRVGLTQHEQLALWSSGLCGLLEPGAAFLHKPFTPADLAL
jgi:fatty-acid desaturase